MIVDDERIHQPTLTMRYAIPLVILSLVAFVSFRTQPVLDTEPKTLYDSIVAMDAAWEDAYNNCKLDVMSDIMSEDLEFYHDQGGMMTSKTKLIEALKNNICNKVTRELKKGSIEVYPIPNYGAVEMGMHGFHNSMEPNSTTHFAKFVHLWKREGGKWRITRVISLH
jgi:ketosteroid isomerase-like protein